MNETRNATRVRRIRLHRRSSIVLLLLLLLLGSATFGGGIRSASVHHSFCGRREGVAATNQIDLCARWQRHEQLHDEIMHCVELDGVRGVRSVGFQ